MLPVYVVCGSRMLEIPHPPVPDCLPGRTVTIQEMEGGSPESLQAVGVTVIKGLQGILHSP